MNRTALLLFVCCLQKTAYALPDNFVYIHDIAPAIEEDIRYASANNFMGRVVPGYKAPLCILTLPAARQLALVQQKATQRGYRLKVYDCYRPVQAVQTFYKWSNNPADTLMKQTFYPRENKKDLFRKGYIALSSGHSRGSTVDLTLVKIDDSSSLAKPALNDCYSQTSAYRDDNSINTGTRFDCLDKSAHVFYANLSKEQKANRALLRKLMISQGFKPYGKEWWHFTLAQEPYPDTYFNFVVR